MSSENCPLHSGFPIRILYETSPFLKSVRWKEVSAIEDVRYGEVSLYLQRVKHNFLNQKCYLCRTNSKNINMIIFFTPYFGLYYRKSKTQWQKENAWPSADSCLDYSFMKNFHFKVVMYGCKLFGSHPFYSGNHEHRGFPKKFPWLIS